MEKLRALAACPCLTSLTQEPAVFQLSEAEPRAARTASDSTQQRHTQPLSATGRVTFTEAERRASRKQLLTPQRGRDPKHKAPRFLDTTITQEPRTCSTFQGGHSLPPRFLRLFIYFHELERDLLPKQLPRWLKYTQAFSTYKVPLN